MSVIIRVISDNETLDSSLKFLIAEIIFVRPQTQDPDATKRGGSPQHHHRFLKK